MHRGKVKSQERRPPKVVIPVRTHSIQPPLKLVQWRL